MGSDYRWNDNRLLRWLDRSTPSLEIYRGGGVWAPYDDTTVWLEGLPVPESELGEYTKLIDG